ncbi:hypothetical protein [Microcoleus anatoxicus]|nr:MAG: hypothetical protein EAZ18_01525 [Oscillatoriales cyanobacterium]
MSRYYHSTRYTSRSPQPPAAPTQINQSWFKSPLILSAILLGLGVVGATLFVEFTTQRIIHIRADDNSDSAETYTAQRQQHCQASIQHYKPGDVAISMSFADRPVTTQNISISNSLSLLGQCKDPKRAIEHMRNLGATWATRLKVKETGFLPRYLVSSRLFFRETRFLVLVGGAFRV